MVSSTASIRHEKRKARQRQTQTLINPIKSTQRHYQRLTVRCRRTRDLLLFVRTKPMAVQRRPHSYTTCNTLYTHSIDRIYFSSSECIHVETVLLFV